MSFKDIFKKSFLEGFATGELTGRVILAALGIAAVLALPSAMGVTSLLTCDLRFNAAFSGASRLSQRWRITGERLLSASAQAR